MKTTTSIPVDGRSVRVTYEEPLGKLISISDFLLLTGEQGSPYRTHRIPAAEKLLMPVDTLGGRQLAAFTTLDGLRMAYEHSRIRARAMKLLDLVDARSKLTEQLAQEEQRHADTLEQRVSQLEQTVAYLASRLDRQA